METDEYLNDNRNDPHFVVRLANGETLDLIYNSVKVYRWDNGTFRIIVQGC